MASNACRLHCCMSFCVVLSLSTCSLVINNNRMRFGEIIVKERKDIAMGMSQAPTIAKLYVSIFEAKQILSNPPRHLSFLWRFINDGFGIWLTDPDLKIDELELNSFKTLINSMGLTWELMERLTTAIFMDLKISILNGCFSVLRLQWWQYEPSEW